MSLFSLLAIVLVLLVLLVFFHDVDLLVRTLSVYLLDVLLSLNKKLFTYILHVSSLRSTLNLVSNHRILHKDFVLQELLI